MDIHSNAFEVQQLELLCKQFYECTDPLLRAKAEKILFDFLEDPDALAKCKMKRIKTRSKLWYSIALFTGQLLLDRGDSAYSQLLASTTLTKLVSRSVQGLSLQQRVDIRYISFWLFHHHFFATESIPFQKLYPQLFSNTILAEFRHTGTNHALGKNYKIRMV
jgi:hypothetical protein